jgi:hypothetical protein
MSNLELTGKRARWALALQEYDFTIKHRPGITHQNADVPSRYPQASDLDLTEARLDIVPAKMALNTVWASPTQAWEQTAQWTVAMEALQQQDGRFATDDAPQGIRTHDAERHAKCLHQVEHALTTATKQSSFNCDPPQSYTRVKQHPQGGKVACEELRMNSVAATFTTAPKGVILYEHFGGLCAGLEMVLRCGIPVAKYFYSDNDPIAQSLARVRMEALHIQYGVLFPSKAFKSPFSLPQDINLVSSDNLLKHGAYDQDTQWMVVAGWECQDLSPAGQGK